METPHQTIARLLTALETLTKQEEHLFETGYYTESTTVQQRSMPLVSKIAELLSGPNVAQTLEIPLQRRVQALLQNRRTHYEKLSDKLELTRLELERINTAQARTRQMRPAYQTRAVASFAAEG